MAEDKQTAATNDQTNETESKIEECVVAMLALPEDLRARALVCLVETFKPEAREEILNQAKMLLAAREAIIEAERHNFMELE